MTQYVASTASWSAAGIPVTVSVHTYEAPPEPGKADFDHGLPDHRPQSVTVDITVAADAPVDFALRLRLPWWLAAAPELTIDGEPVDLPLAPGTFQEVRRSWTDNRLRLVLPTALVAVPMPDQPETVALMDGPIVLAGLVGERRTLHGSVDDPLTFLEPVSELELGVWQKHWMTRGQTADIKLVPLHEITDETYTVYFPVKAAES